MRSLFSVTLIAAALLARATPGASAEALTRLTITVDVSACIAGYSGPLPDLSVWLGNPRRQGGQIAPAHPPYRISAPVRRGDRTVRVSFDVVSDAYYIAADLRTPDSTLACHSTMGIVAIVLPGHPVATTASLIPMAIADAIAFTYVAGLVDRGITLSLKTSAKPIACDSTVAPGPLAAFAPDRDGDAYTATIGGGGAAADRMNFVVATLTDGSKNATVVLPVKNVFNVGENSTFYRFDATKAVLDSYASGGGAIARCLRD